MHKNKDIEFTFSRFEARTQKGKNMFKAITKNTKGASLLDYGIIVALVATTGIGAVFALGTEVEETFVGVESEVSTALETAQLVSLETPAPAPGSPLLTIALDGDENVVLDRTTWQLLDPDGYVVAGAAFTSSALETVTYVPVKSGAYVFVVQDPFGDGLGGSDPASYSVVDQDGNLLVGSDLNPNFGTTAASSFDFNV